ncbi:hypothetical protein HCH_01187 [Hahella chejuensis KCTC 2396]|uniref:DUF11 domain-containing protein n=1 Tax=Hahella chejuensis (strain KCTC 2396) TaxID=349521 RepID=Q2SMR2_HAHCH|nr:DUF11 domain-containing protein [Hahella chejuensis]ABC28062.1 hypothetical protein HCH_01187 [Hahella chejuensis KCTC 2396]
MKKLIAAGLLSCPALGFALEISAPIVGNATFSDNDVDGRFESIYSTSYLYVHWRNVNYLNQRYARRAVIEIDLSEFPDDRRLEQAWFEFDLTGYSNKPNVAFWGYSGDGVVDLSDAERGEALIATQAIDGTGDWRVDLSQYARKLKAEGKRYLGVNIRSTNEGKRETTYDDEITFPGYQSNSDVFKGVRFLMSDEPGAPYTPDNVLFQHHFEWGMPSQDEGFQFRSSNRGGRMNVVNGRLRMDQTNYFSTPTSNEMDWTVDLSNASQVRLSFYQAETSDEAAMLPESFAGSAEGDGVSISNNGVDWYPVVNADRLDLGAAGGRVEVDLDAQVERIRATLDSTFEYGPDFKIRFQQFGVSKFGYDGRDWGDLLLTGRHVGDATDLEAAFAAPVETVVNADTEVKFNITNLGSYKAVGARAKLTLPVSARTLSTPAGCERAGDLITCFAGELEPGAEKEFVLSFKPSQEGRLPMSLTVGAATNDPVEQNNVSNHDIPVLAGPALVPADIQLNPN